MNLETLKKSIEDGSFNNSSIIFVSPENDFVARQYIHKIALNRGLIIESRETTDGLFLPTLEENDNTMYVVSTDTLEMISRRILSKNNIYVITKKISKCVKESFDSIIVTIPKLESWQVKDYAYSIGEGIRQDRLDNLIGQVGENIFALDSILSMVSAFPVEARDAVFCDMISDGVVSTGNQKVFDLSNAICRKDRQAISNLYSLKYGCNEFGFLSILISAFRNIIGVQMAKNPAAELPNLSTKQIYAIKKSCGIYTKDQLEKIMLFLYSIDLRVKSGEIETKYLFDYLVDKILTI